MKLSPAEVITHAPHLKAPPRALEAPPLMLPEQTLGLGDVVAAVAQPIARAVDKLTGSRIAKCQPCACRKNFLNRLVPDIRKPFNKFRRK